MSDTLRSKLMVGRHTLPNALMLLVPCQTLCSHCALYPDAGDDRLGGGDCSVQRHVHGR